MRDAFVKELEKLAETNDKLVLLSGDIGNRMFDRFKAAHPDRFYNCGIAEANMASVAAGLALEGFIPVIYTIAPFATTRCLEQIKIDLCYHNLHVIIAGTGAGLSYAPLGPTHHSAEDIAILRVMPNMRVLCPCDATETKLALAAAVNSHGPAYLRLGKKGEPVIFPEPYSFAIGNPTPVIDGKDVCLLGIGNTVPQCLEAAKMLENDGISAAVYSYHTIKPKNEAFLRDIFSKFKKVCTVEEHFLAGGGGSSVAEWLADSGISGAKLIRCGIDDTFMKTTGSQSYAHGLFGLDSETIRKRILGGK